MRTHANHAEALRLGLEQTNIMLPHNKTCCMWAALFALVCAVSAHKSPGASDDEAPEVDGVERDLDNTWLLDQSFLIFCMLFSFAVSF